MLVRYILHIGDSDYELREDDLDNWDEIQWSCKRADYDGVVRSCTSQFIFVNRAKELLKELYLKDGFNAAASVSILVADNRWNYVEQFRCPLDFSTLTMDSCRVSINSVDNTLAALIKANKGTKYEFEVDTDIPVAKTLFYDRVAMLENATFGFTQGDSFSNSSDLTVTFKAGELPWVGCIGSEITVNKVLYWNDDQKTEEASYLLEAYRNCTVTLEYDLAWRANYGKCPVYLGVFIRRGEEYLPAGDGTGGNFAGSVGNEGSFHKVELEDGALPDPASIETISGAYAVISGNVWELKYNGRGYVWINTNKSEADYFLRELSGKVELSLKTGDRVVIRHRIDAEDVDSTTVRFAKSKFVFSWIAKGDPVTIDLISPVKAAEALLHKMAEGKPRANVSLSGFDPRLARTYLIAAESARSLEGAKFYSSFSEFCDWMKTVFGYVYYIGEYKPKFTGIKVCGKIEGDPWNYDEQRYEGAVDVSNIVYIPAHGRFFYAVGTTLYTEWRGSEAYNNPGTGHPQTNTLYRILELSETNLYYFEPYAGGYHSPILYDGSDEELVDGKTVYFVHRSELFNPNTGIRRLRDCRDVQYTVDSSSIYSTVTVGYEKKDYDNINGREEFNFNHTYSTGCTVSDKTLPLLSKYRADCYGIEFAVQKRGRDTTDSSSDQSVFFILTQRKEYDVVPDRTATIENALTDTVFNCAFNPVACVMANAGFIGMQAEELGLKFASSAASSSVVIDGRPMSEDLMLDTPLVSCGVIEFASDDIDELADFDELIEVPDSDGTTYRGFLKEVDAKYAKTAAANYKLLVKDIVR